MILFIQTGVFYPNHWRNDQVYEILWRKICFYAKSHSLCDYHVHYRNKPRENFIQRWLSQDNLACRTQVTSCFISVLRAKNAVKTTAIELMFFLAFFLVVNIIKMYTYELADRVVTRIVGNGTVQCRKPDILLYLHSCNKVTLLLFSNLIAPKT